MPCHSVRLTNIPISPQNKRVRTAAQAAKRPCHQPTMKYWTALKNTKRHSTGFTTSLQATRWAASTTLRSTNMKQPWQTRQHAKAIHLTARTKKPTRPFTDCQHPTGRCSTHCWPRQVAVSYSSTATGHIRQVPKTSVSRCSITAMEP